MSDASLNASDPTRSAWVAANAGAGKTHTLANRVTRLLLADARPERILCLTYTKAAAAEMQDRLFNQLGKWSMLPDKELAANIRGIGAESSDAKELRKARRLFAQALETPGGLKIQDHSCRFLPEPCSLGGFPIEAGHAADRSTFQTTSQRRAILMTEAVRVRAGTGERPAKWPTVIRHAVDAHRNAETSEFLHGSSFSDAALGGDRRKIERFFAILHGGDAADTREIRRGAHGGGARTTPEDSVAAACSWRRWIVLSSLPRSSPWLVSGGGRPI